MKKKFTLLAVALLAAAGARAQQIPNSDFTSWKSICGNSYCWTASILNSFGSDGELAIRPGTEPTSWNGSNLNQKNFASVSNPDLVTNVTVDGHNGVVQLKNIRPSRWSTLIAPGFISFGTPWVYPHANSNNADGGVYGGRDFTYKPDAIKGTFKRTVSTAENAHIIVYLWNGTFTSKIGDKKSPTHEVSNQDRAVMGLTTSTGDGKLIASCDYTFGTTQNNDWEEITVPLEYVDGRESLTPAKVNVILSAADYWNRDNMKANNILQADNVDFVYYHSLTALSYDGTSIYKEGTTNYNLSSKVYDAELLSYTKKGVGATVESTYDEASALLTLTVKGNDYDANADSKTVYTIQFKKTDKTASQLTALSYDGTPVSGFDPATFSYDLSSTPYNEDAALTYTTKSSGAKVTKSYNATTAQLTLTVTTADYNAATETGSKSTYTLQFDKATTTSASNAFSTVVDDEASAPTASVSYDVTTYAKSNVAAIVFKNLTVPVGSEKVSVSKINATNLTVKVVKKASELTHTKAVYGYSFDGKLTIDGTAYAATLDARNDLNTGKCNVRLTLKNFHSKDVTLIFAPAFEVNKEVEIAPEEGLGIAHFSRSFKKGWNTLCLPFETTVEKLGAAEADTLSATVTTDRKNGTATFLKVPTGVIKRGLPHLVYFNTATDAEFYFAGDVSDELIDGNGAIEGALPFKFTGNYDGIISMYETFSIQGYAVGYGLVTADDGSATIRIAGKGATLPSTCAFFGFEEDQSGNIGTSISLEFVDSSVTGIHDAFTFSNGEVKHKATGVFTLQGIKVSNGSTQGLPAGLYIVNGKKTIVR